MYEYTDALLKVYRKRMISVFTRYKSILHIDELNVLNGSERMYNELEAIAEKCFLKIAKKYYNHYAKTEKTDIDRDWLLDFLEDYEPTVKYVYLHEVDRKRQRFAEYLLSTGKKDEAFKDALRYWNDMFTQFAILTTDKATLTAYKDNGIKKVKWYTIPDERRCGTCRKLHGMIFPINEVPPKPHWKCRCYYVPIKS